MTVKKGLGRGLDALITRGGEEVNEGAKVLEIDINKIEPNRDQPRTDFDKDELEELAESIRVYGIISPLLTRKEGDFYTIIAGERRWRAARLAGLKTLPVIVREFDQRETLEVALIENLQRSDLNPMEEALSYRRLLDDFGLTQEGIASRIGKSRSAVANALRLLKLPESVSEMLRKGQLSTGHAKVLLSLDDEKEISAFAEKASSGGYSVRELEEAVKAAKNNQAEKPAKKGAGKGPSMYSNLEMELTGALYARTRIKTGKDGESGRIEIEFASKDELDRLYLALRNL